MTQTKILLFGKRGQLGWELNKLLSSENYQVYAYSSDEVNVSDLLHVKKTVEEIKPHLIINASAYTAVDRAEEESQVAMRINAEAPGVMAESAKNIQASLIHYSTDYVFDGTKNVPYTENDSTNPLNMYGKSKLKGEQAIGQVGGGFVILRTSWVYNLCGDNFVTKVISWAKENRDLKVVTDQVGSPTSAYALAQITNDLIKQSRSDLKNFFLSKQGIYHLGGIGSVSRFDFAKSILRLIPDIKLDTVIEPSLTSDFPTPATRPLYTALDCTKFEQNFYLSLPSWEDSLKFTLLEH